MRVAIETGAIEGAKHKGNALRRALEKYPELEKAESAAQAGSNFGNAPLSALTPGPRTTIEHLPIELQWDLYELLRQPLVTGSDEEGSNHKRFSIEPLNSLALVSRS